LGVASHTVKLSVYVLVRLQLSSQISIRQWLEMLIVDTKIKHPIYYIDEKKHGYSLQQCLLVARIEIHESN
jgi:hypothetical protein